MKALADDGDKAEGLERRLGYAFNDIGLLALALTHASTRGGQGAATASNERLEFLGDRVLGLIVADLLYRRFPDEPEGDLARRHAVLVSRPILSAVATRLRLGPSIAVSRGERVAGGTNSANILADACEAVIGAVYLDGGLPAAAAFIEAHWSDPIDDALEPPKDPKTCLQEWAQGRGLGLPVYREIERHGPDHAPEFVIEVCLAGMQPVAAVGASKRIAEQAAAERLLDRLRGAGESGAGDGDARDRT